MLALRVGVVLWPTVGWREAASDWLRVEALGFAHAWVYDHLSWRGITPWHDCYSTLAAAAAVTSRIELGPLVTTPNFRHPVPTAKALLSIQDIAEGRLQAGLGAGATSSDAGALGEGDWSARERADRFCEWVTLLARLLREPTTTATGRFYSASCAAVGGSEHARLPLAIAATGTRGLQLVARYATTWIAQDKPTQDIDGYASVQRQLRRLDQACGEIGRDARELRRLLVAGNGDAQPMRSLDDFERCVERYAALGFTDLVVHAARQQPPHHAEPPMLERIAARF